MVRSEDCKASGLWLLVGYKTTRVWTLPVHGINLNPAYLKAKTDSGTGDDIRTLLPIP